MSHSLSDAAFNFVADPNNFRVVYGVLKRLHISPRHQDYEDLLSEGRLIYVDVFMEYVSQIDDHDPAALHRYAYQRLYWRLLDYLRKKTVTTQHQTSLPDHSTQPDPQIDVAHQLETSDLCQLIQTRLDQDERQFLGDLLTEPLNLTVLATKYQISRPTLYKRRRHLANKLRLTLPDFFNPNGYNIKNK
ncbi:sigma-70 RNA polymerase sigma factor region 4 domain-containing protein [Furfurilactobacillus curtus]|uniref:Sigma-70 family RNA polymerase sigma factor n=1 Tax=Furfurilactobacillus curtus TaxID=1746200 RepID=A0ABQ5JLL0_9LACO